MTINNDAINWTAMNQFQLPLILLLCLAPEAAGFASHHTTRCSSCHRTSSSRLNDSLFSGEDEVQLDDILPPENYNDDAPPFSEFETERDRKRRMEMARELQKVFYTEEPKSSSLIIPSNENNNAYGSTVLRNLPTLTSNDGIKGADKSALLPGYQFVWTITNSMHCHMFHSILSGPAPWFFAHVHFPKSSASSGESETSEDEGAEPIIDNLQSWNDMNAQLKSNNSPVYGTLLRITDRRFQDEDGSIVLAVQAIDRIRVHSVTSVPGTSLCTDVQLSPEQELMNKYFDMALMSSASYLSSHSDTADTDATSEALSGPSAISGAARAAAAADTSRVRRFEYLPIYLVERPKRPSSTLQSRSSDSNATKKIKDAIRKQDKAKEESAPEYANIVQLANYDVFGYSSMGNTDSVTSQALKMYWMHLAKETSQDTSDEDDLFSMHNTEASSSFFLPEPSSSPSGPSASVEAVVMMEFHVWRTLDEMIRLLSLAASATVPLPSQLLGLLPKRDDWPREFALEGYAKSMATSGNTIGTAFKSPFVRVDQITSANPSSYSPLRRAQRLSYAIWSLLDLLAISGAQPPPPPRHEILNMEGIEQRLSAAKQTLDGINFVLKKLIQENQKGNDNK
ncbi:hypothetical protein ACHAXR_008908 [Thalassiosira sp. AJA248-18]